MRRLALLSLLVAGFAPACVTGTRSHERDERLQREITRQQRWAEDAIRDRATPDELARIRQSDYEAVSAGRKKLRRLIQGIDRGTWVRDAIVEDLRAGDDDPELLRAFDRAGQLRRDCAAAADELADALSEARSSIAIADLRPGFDALKKAQQSEARLPNAIPGGRVRLQPAPLPTPRPFVTAAAKVVRAHPDQQRDLDRLAPEDATQVRSQLSQLELRPGSPGSDDAPQDRAVPPVREPSPPLPDDQGGGHREQATIPPDELSIQGDAKNTLARRGPPDAFVVRPDGLFGMRYDDLEIVFDPSGKKVREEPATAPAR